MILWVFAGIGVVYVGAMAFLTVAGPRFICELQMRGTAVSPDGMYVARFEQLACPADAGRSGGTVLISKISEPKRGTQVLHVPLTTSDVALTWQGPRKLLISVPQGTSTSYLNSTPYGDDVVIALRTSREAAPAVSERLPSGRSVSFVSQRRQEDFKDWLGAQRIPFLLESVRGQEFVIWDEQDTEQVLRWERLGEESAGADLVQRVNDLKSGH